MGPCGWLSSLRNQIKKPELDKLGIASPPGPAYVGGSSLVIWQHSSRASDALRLIHFLTSQQVQVDYLHSICQIPTRTEALEKPPYTTDPHLRAVVKTLETGRPLPVFPQLALVDEKLSEALAKLWGIVLSDPNQDLDALVTSYMKNIARRIVVALGFRK